MDLDKLALALQRGEPWAAHALVTVLGPVLLGYANLIGSDLSQADREHAVETAILRGAERIDQYDPQRAGLGAWLRPFVRHTLADIRRTRGLTVDLTGIGPLPDEEHVAPDPRPEAEQLGWLVRELPVADQVIIMMKDYEQLSYRTIAERIGGVSEGACRVRHHRAIRRLAVLADSRDEFAALRSGSLDA